MPKLCDYPGCKHDAKSKGKCWYHVPRKAIKKSSTPLKRTPIKNKAYRISKVSKSQAARLRKWGPIRDAFMALPENKYCAVDGCNNLSTDPHHPQGKIGDLLFDTTIIVALCRGCHDKAHADPEWAMALKISRYRVKINH